jgi:N-acetylmuramoyl-L-alanine amidase
MFKIAYCAGHYLGTAGKRVPKTLDPNQTREWTLNDRVARYFAQAAKQYEGVEILRVDDTTGKKEVSLSARCKAANSWGADVYLSCHHNAGINLGNGGGIVAFCYKVGTKAATYRDAIYKACIAAGGLKGNRSNPTPEKGYYVLKHTKMPAVLTEYGFMDSKTDAPVILTEAYAKLVGYATMEAVAKVAGLKKKPEKVYCVQVGAFVNKDYADQMLKNLEASGFRGFITEKEN